MELLTARDLDYALNSKLSRAWMPASYLRSLAMRRVKSGWSEGDRNKLKALVASGASPYRASVALGRSLHSTKNKARELGYPFPTLQSIKSRVREILRR
jgi:hypothetical protein